MERVRKIIHFDMDCFFAAVEIRDNPELRGKPVVIGGDPKSRGVVSTASYEARAYGIRSAMPSARAFALCPHAVFIRGSFSKYREASRQIREIFANYTDLIEPVSIDEAYLDVTGNQDFKYASQIAKQIQRDIFELTQLTGSAGVASNKLLAKIASDMNKPNGLTVVRPEHAEAFMGPLSLRKIPGIGPAAEEKLRKNGLKLCTDVWGYDPGALREAFGERMATWLQKRSRGVDSREVQTSRARKSLGTERTFAKDIYDLEMLREVVRKLSLEVSAGLAKKELLGRTITLKIKYADFQQITRSKSLGDLTNSSEVVRDTALELLGVHPAQEKSIRLLGVTVSNFEEREEKKSKAAVFLEKQICFEFLN